MKYFLNVLNVRMKQFKDMEYPKKLTAKSFTELIKTLIKLKI